MLLLQLEGTPVLAQGSTLRFTTSVSPSQPKPQHLRPPHLGCWTSQQPHLQGDCLPLQLQQQQADHQLPPLSPPPQPLLRLQQGRPRDNITSSPQRVRAKRVRGARWRRWRRSRSTSSLASLSPSQLSLQFSHFYFAIRCGVVVEPRHKARVAFVRPALVKMCSTPTTSLAAVVRPPAPK